MSFRSLLASPKSRLAARPRPVRLALAPLEDRLAPALAFSDVLVGNTLVITQTAPANASVRIVDNATAGKVTIDDPAVGTAPVEFSTAGSRNLVIRLSPADAVAVEYRTDSDRAGSVSLSIRNQFDRNLNLTGSGQIGGNLTVTGGDGGLTVTEVGTLRVVGSSTFRGGAGYDILSLGGQNTAIGPLTTLGFNAVGTNPGDKVGRVVFKDPGGEHDDGLTLDGTQVAGGLTYVGGTKSDKVVIGGNLQPTMMTGAVRINFGTQDGLATSNVTQHNVLSVITGRVLVSGSPVGVDDVQLLGRVNGDMRFNLGGGTNKIGVTGATHGATFRYAGGSGVDEITYKPSFASVRAQFIARLGDGADKVTFTTQVGPLPGTPVNPKFAFIDFGAGSDSFTGVVNFDCQFLNLV